MQTKSNDKGFKALLATQFLGAFNDNAFKFVIAALVVDMMDTTGNGTLYLALSGAVFILPFLLFSTFAGYLADKLSKQKIIVFTKVLEFFVMAIGFYALVQNNILAMLIVLFFMGLQSALFGPSKYGILPEILSNKELPNGNGIIQMWTYVAVLLGQTSYGALMDYTNPFYYKAAYVFMSVSLLGILTSLFITKVKPSGGNRPFRLNIVGDIISNIKWIKKDKAIFLSMIGLAYFGFLGGVFQPNILLYARKVMGIEHIQTGFLISALTVGLGLGCFLAGRLSDQKVELGLVPLGAMGLSIFSVLLGFTSHSYLLALGVMFLLGFSCGFYIVPLNTLIQQKSPPDRRGQVLATSNVLTFLAILFGSIFLYVLRDFVHLNAAQIFVVTGVLTIAATLYTFSILPYAFVRFVMWMLTHTVYRIKVLNRNNVPEKGGALLVSNHVSYIDALMLIVTIARPIRFMVFKEIYDIKWLNPLFRLGNAIPISGKENPKDVIKSLHTARDAIRNGELVCIYAEGELSRTGNMLKFNRGLEKIMKGLDNPIIPVHLDRMWGSIFSYDRGKYFFKKPRVIPYPITVSYGKPIPAQSSTFTVRNRVMELGADAFPHRLSDRFTLSEAFWKEARKHPKSFCVADSGGKSLNYSATLTASVALSTKLQSLVGESKNVGVLIPPCVGGVLVNVALSILHKIPVNLNYTTSPEAFVSIVNQCEMKCIITSKKFLEKIKMEVPGKVIFIEDLVPSMTKKDKVIAFIKSLLAPRWLSYRLIFGSRKMRCMSDLATIMFTSGSTGEPKGVMLTHSNITSNLDGLYQTFHVANNDVIMGVLPFFHSFGFTATLWFPLISGMGAVYHVNPLDSKVIGKLVQKHKATILMSTPTFLNSYIRRCTEEQFQSLKTVVVGAEKLKEQVACAFKEKFGIDAMEGYGCTELSPIVSMNLPDYQEDGVLQKKYKPGKIGLPLPGIAIKILDQNTMEPVEVNASGLLYIKGPNVMKGYLNREELTQAVITDGWYKTGDVANMDEDGFLTITDRVSRFSKIAGEMVPHIKIEEKIHELLNSSDQVCIVTSIPDDKKGEKLVVLHLDSIDVKSLVEQLKTSDLPNLWIPDAKMFHAIEEIPILGTGKLNLGKVKVIAKEIFD
ncbi:Lysophospholipid transporter LplT / 2-acylglycerophosphoethanolamine acyltransferase / Acyl-[acyl-carrier-protein] synthetase [hydrothermal vent metagenome]|uniref:Lysophospholipid transporter LplT / 2-acylglycerophosphoethanolamine acyltransferase / Acyl-[acyl-carrier-protein] synthetase n=1 Tax=hydrothermal vent metagenome TaxID=652676 RepID=A0A3B1CY11_9ZZZZ